MNRRAFLSLLGTGSAGLVLARSIPDVLLFDRAVLFSPHSSDGPILGAQALISAFQREFDKHLRPSVMLRGDEDGYFIGQRIGDDIPAHQLAVNSGLHLEAGLTRIQLVREAIALADRCNQFKVLRFAPLNVPTAGVDWASRAHSPRSSVRAIMQYNIMEDRTILRFDCLITEAA